MSLIDGDFETWKQAFVSGVPGLMTYFIKRYPDFAHSKNSSWAMDAYKLPREEKEQLLAQFYIEREE